MKKIFIKSLILVAIPFVIVWSSSKYDNIYYPNDSNVYRPSMAHQEKQLDYLFVGNSYTYSSIHIPIFEKKGFRTFNLGIATAGLNFYTLLIDDYLKHCQSFPKNIVILLSPTTFSTKADNFVKIPIHRYLIEPISHFNLLWEQRISLSSYFLLERNSSKKGLRNLIRGQYSGTKGTENRVRENGGFEPDSTFYTTKLFEKQKSLYKNLSKSTYFQESLTRLMVYSKKLKEKGINVIFHTVPTFKLESFCNQTFLDNYQNALDTIEASNYTLIRHNMTLDSTHFRNLDHINYKGAIVYSNFLISKLIQNKL